jgi:glutamine amidotransferase
LLKRMGAGLQYLRLCETVKINALVIDYGMGNLQSVENALRFCGCTPVISGEPKEIAQADCLLLPGVGSFRKAMTTIEETGIADAMREAVLNKKRKILGICLGMQLLGLKGSEDGESPGLGFVCESVDRFSKPAIGQLKVPHVGFNDVYWDEPGEMFRGMTSPRDYYFVHSYRMLRVQGEGVFTAISKHGEEFTAAFQKQNIFGTQFHPEKSQTNGIMLLQNFLEF